MNFKKIFTLSKPFIIGVACALIITGWLPKIKGFFQTTESTSISNMPIIQNDSYSHIVAPVLPSIVTIYSTKITENSSKPTFDDPLFKNQFLNERVESYSKTSNIGSGVIIHPDGYVLTNHHIINAAKYITIVLADGRETKAEIIGVDIESDLAVLKIHLNNLQPIKIEQDTQPNTGDIVFTVGNPYGLGQSVSMGILSATGRSHIGLTKYENYLQTDAAINPGSSGGALINAKGNLIGINTANLTNSGGSQGIGFAIPSEIALDAASQIIENGKVTRGYLGILNTNILTVAQSQQLGIDFYAFKIDQLQKNGPAHLAGMIEGDIWVQIEGEPILNPNNVQNKIAKLEPGSILTIQVLRDSNYVDLEITLGSRSNIQ